MIDTKKQKHSLSGIELLRSLANQGLRIFTFEDARKAAHQLEINTSYVAEALSHLKQHGWIKGLKKGIYVFTQESGISEPPHELEIAQVLVPRSVISYWTAMRHYHMTEQLPHTTFSMAPAQVNIPRTISSKRFCFIKAKKEYFFGITTVWVNQAKISITDPERTLLEGLRHPEYCGGFREVLSSFKSFSDKLDLNKLVDYACHLERAISKRLGWILEHLKVENSMLERLENVPMKGPRYLDPSGERKGKYNKKWKLLENI